ncbi:2OG-Fe(II) oxygenase [Sphingomonas sp. LY160]|uniref:prolyl hydroxylase family protein n=1 Tax=Sphingomonas sp. LY160 TaxID=3095342 RepID=UPI002ADEFBB3|nr:2OG-Fe(II) oxygenase [Sphingomonas sp. LY160]MEA1072435.1 2OG-Fe(II) oxygenase [Sphingomonas sp. LY160]
MAADEVGPAARLAARSGVQRFPNRALELFVVREFLNEADCNGLCAMIDAKRRPSTIADDLGDPGFRTSETCDLDGNHPLVARVRSMLSDLTGIPLDRAEPIQGQRYAPGQEFKPHTDTFNPGGADFFVHTADQGQRTWTAMLYLNQPEDGGATRFKTLGKTIQPENGKLLLWNNLLPDGSPNNASLHQGMKVRRGAKYIITQWYRERAAA